jgi:hypothetical protein
MVTIRRPFYPRKAAWQCQSTLVLHLRGLLVSFWLHTKSLPLSLSLPVLLSDCFVNPLLLRISYIDNIVLQNSGSSNVLDASGVIVFPFLRLQTSMKLTQTPLIS